MEQRDVDFRSRGRTAIARAIAIKEFIQPWHLRCTAVYGPGHVEALARVVGNRIGKLSEL